MLHEGKVFLVCLFLSSFTLSFFLYSFQQSHMLFMVNKLTDYSKVFAELCGLGVMWDSKEVTTRRNSGAQRVGSHRRDRAMNF